MLIWYEIHFMLVLQQITIRPWAQSRRVSHSRWQSWEWLRRRWIAGIILQLNKSYTEKRLRPNSEENWELSLRRVWPGRSNRWEKVNIQSNQLPFLSTSSWVIRKFYLLSFWQRFYRLNSLMDTGQRSQRFWHILNQTREENGGITSELIHLEKCITYITIPKELASFWKIFQRKNNNL